jgi:hypothetical protein
MSRTCYVTLDVEGDSTREETPENVDELRYTLTKYLAVQAIQ